MIINVNFDNGGYDVVIERGILERAGEFLRLDRKILIVSDSGVPEEYSDTILSFCRDGYKYIIGEGEENKNFDNLRKICEFMLEKGFTRKDAVIAVGGGIVGDLAGFAASIYERGIDFYNIPTTLLSQVDSSVGGKVASNLGGIKNSVGAFKRPEKVLIDPDVLATLPEREFNCGIAEAIKMAATFDASIFEKFEKNDVRKNIDPIIANSIEMKRKIVEADEKEGGIRRSLNFGHTIGHGIESTSGGKFLHGECVAMGMLCFCGEKVSSRLKNVLEKYGLPTSFSGDKEKVFEALKHDKKTQNGIIHTIWVNEIGSFEEKDLTFDEIYERIDIIR